MCILSAEKIDPRLAIVRKAFVQSRDNVSDDQPVAACVTEHLEGIIPILSAKTREEADVVIEVHSASIGKHPTAKVTAALRDGTKLWDG